VFTSLQVNRTGIDMIILATMLASGQVLPWIDRPWLTEQVRLEGVAAGSPKRPLKLILPAAPASRRRLLSFENTIGM
jgi:hypothetical protein